MKITQLFISPVYVPIDTSNSLINARIIDRLMEYDVETVVVTADSSDITGYTITPSLSEAFKAPLKTYRIKLYTKGWNVAALFQKIIRRAIPVFDFYFIWTLLAVIKLFKIRKECKVDIIHSVSSPFYSHIVGYFAKIILKKPWICHLDDFWVDHPRKNPTIQRIRDIELEKKCFRRANIVLFTAQGILDLAKKRYHEKITNKFIFIPPAYDSRHYPHIEAAGNKYKFVYLGVFYKNCREPLTFLAAIKKIKNECPNIYRNLEIELIGEDSAGYLNIIADYNIDDVVKCKSRINYLESIRKMKEASVLIHIGYLPKGSSSDIHVSGKLFEYVGASRLILGITTLTGPAADFIRKVNGMVCNYNDPSSISETIIKIISLYSIEDLHNWKNPSQVSESYEIGTIVEKYLKLFETAKEKNHGALHAS